jgi:uncharacterized protein
MREPLFWDTSAIYAYINRKDPAHESVKQVVSVFRGRLVLSNYIFDEIATLVLSRLGHAAAVHIGNVLMNSPQIERQWISSQDEINAWALFSERQDKQYSFTDCTSFVLMRRLGVKKYIALDDHFRQEGFKNVIP